MMTRTAIWSTAVRDVAAVSPGMIPFGLALGVTMTTFGINPIAGILGAGIVYGGSAQLAAVTLLHNGVGLLAVVGTAAIVNTRLLLYSAALSPSYRGQPRWFRLLAPHYIIDQTYLFATSRTEFTGRAFRSYWLSLGTALLVMWTGAVAVGMLLGPVLPSMPHLAFVGSALFLGMLVPRVTSSASLAAASAGGGGAALVAFIRPELGIIAGAVTGVAAGMAVHTR
jgi:predicted branched-subunit amino acid permease